MSLKNIKGKIRTIDKTHKVTKAMEAVSAVKMRKSQERALAARPYATSALTILGRVSESEDAKRHPLGEVRPIRNICFLIVTSDKGLAGSLNSAVIKAVRETLAEKDLDQHSVSFLSIGTKGRDFFAKRGYNVRKHFSNIGDSVSVEDMYEVTKTLTDLFLNQDVDAAYVAYTNFRSTFEQNAVVRQVLPLSFEDVTRVIEGILPEKGKNARPAQEDTSSLVYTIEPNPEEVFDELMPFLLNIELYHTLLEAKASEHSARMVAMKNASDKAEELSDELNLEFNKERQAMITREVSEIIGGMEVMR